MYFQFIVNIFQVLFFCGIIILIDLSLHKRYSHLAMGIVFGLVTLFVMAGNVKVNEGNLFDFRHITMTMAGFIGGPETAGIAAIISSVYRYYLGGTGSMGGITTIITFGCFGAILGKLLRNRQKGIRLFFWFAVGLVMTGILLFIIACILPNPGLKSIFGPYLIITPLASTILFNFYYWAYDFFSKASVLNTIIKSSPVNLIIFDKNGPLLTSENLKRHSESSVYAKISAAWPKEDRAGFNIIQQHQEIVADNGKYFVADFNGFQMPNGEPACVAILTDLTDRKKEQETIKRLKDRFAKAFDFAPHMMAIISKFDFKYVEVNRRFLETRGYAPENVIGKTPVEIGVSESNFNKVIEMLEAQGMVQNLEYPMITKSGKTGTVIISAQNIQVEEQECILFAYNDVTEIKQMQAEKVEQLNQRIKLEEELSRSNQLIADIITNMPDPFFVLDNQYRFTYLNKKAEELLLKTREELLGSNFWEAFPQTRGTIIETNSLKAVRHNVPITFESLSYIQENTWYQVNVYPLLAGVAVYYTDVTEQKFMREKLIKSKKEMTAILESMTDCFFAIDDNWRFTYVNPAAEIAFRKSRDQLLGRNLTEVFKVNKSALESYWKVMNEKRSLNIEIIMETLGNKWLEVSIYPADNGLTCYFRDITSRKLAEKEISRLDRLNLVGQMAAGIGHEIRNPMTTVRGYLQLLGSKPQNEAQKPIFDLMISELDRANSIISEFLSLARTKQTTLQLQNLNDILSGLYPLLEADTYTQNKQIEYIKEPIPDLELNKKEISQLVLNLARNGLEAMGEGGRLMIKTYLRDDRVILAIEDEGCGIPSEDLYKLGTPFFTTKDEGTGLGMATSFKIVEAHKAKIDIDTSPRGTKFLISFPVPEKVQIGDRMVV